MTDHHPNIKEDFEFDGKGVRQTEFVTRATCSDGRTRKWGLRVSGEISTERRAEIYANFDKVIKAAKANYDPNYLPSL